MGDQYPARQAIRVAFGHRIKLLRTQRGWTQEQLAARVRPDTSASVISQIERATGTYNPSQAFTLALAEALGVPVHVLYGSEEQGAMWQDLDERDRDLLRRIHLLTEAQYALLIHVLDTVLTQPPAAS
jgi:transcriptional regulator with XRE-family HTH domain